MPSVSVIMSTLNTPEEYLRASIESILNQTFSDFEFIIVDDGSTAEDCKIIKSYQDNRIVLLRNETNKGLPYSLNRGINAAQGKYVMRMDSDDIALPFRIAEQYVYMEAHEDIDVLGGLGWMFGAKSGLIGATVIPDELNMLLHFKNRLIHPSVMIRKSFLDCHNLRYNENFKRSQDYELWSRVIAMGKVAVLPTIVLKYRVHEKQASVQHSDDQKRMGYHIYKSMFSSWGIDFTENQNDMHYALVNAKPEDYRQLIVWAKTLKQVNKKNKKYNSRKFNLEVNYRLYFNLLRNIAERKYSLSFRLIGALLSPCNLCGFVYQSIVYKNVQRKLQRQNKKIIAEHCNKNK